MRGVVLNAASTKQEAHDHTYFIYSKERFIDQQLPAIIFNTGQIRSGLQVRSCRPGRRGVAAFDESVHQQKQGAWQAAQCSALYTMAAEAGGGYVLSKKGYLA